MIRIGCISDTHGFIHERLIDFLKDVDEIWHAGDIGNLEVAAELEKIKPLRAVHGNIDSADIRNIYPAHQKFEIENMKVWLTHIGGYPGNYDRSIKQELISCIPDIFVCGHSHILKIMFDKRLNLLYLNPGAAGNSGLHQFITALKFRINEKKVTDMEVWELKRR